MERIRSRTTCLTSTYPAVVTSPATTTRPVVRSVSTATRLCGSWRSISSRTESLIWSAILSGCPSVTDSEVKRRPATASYPLPHRSQPVQSQLCIRSVRLPAQATNPGMVSAGAEPRRDAVPDGVRKHRLGAPRHVGALPGGVEDDGFVLGGAEGLAPAHVVDDQQVAALAGQLGPREVEHRGGRVTGLGREPDDHAPR